MLLSFKYFKQVYYAIFILAAIVITGTVGFYFVEHFTWSEAFYMTIITVSTVGFSEVHELSDAGRMFTSLLIITSFGTFAYALSSITRYIVGGEYRTYFKDFKVNKEINKLNNHIIVCGYGRNGKQATLKLAAHQQPFVIVEENESVLDKVRENKSLLYIKGDSTKEEYLIQAGIYNASAIITTLPKDSDNLFVVLTARELNPKLNIISRATEENSKKKMRFAGANQIVMPDKVGGQHMASLVISPDVVEFLDQISIEGKADINLEEISFSNIPEGNKHKTIRELETRYKTGTTIIGFKSPDGKYIINPSPDLEIIPDSKLFVLGSPEQIHRLNNIFGVKIPN